MFNLKNFLIFTRKTAQRKIRNVSLQATQFGQTFYIIIFNNICVYYLVKWIKFQIWWFFMLIEKKGMKLLISIYKKQRFHELQLLQSQLPTIVIVESPVSGTHLMRPCSSLHWFRKDFCLWEKKVSGVICCQRFNCTYSINRKA